MRMIVRFSVDGEKNGALRNKLAKALTSASLVKHPSKTATYESRSVQLAAVRTALDTFWEKALNHKGNGTLDHVWVYLDENPKLPKPKAKRKP